MLQTQETDPVELNDPPLGQPAVPAFDEDEGNCDVKDEEITVEHLMPLLISFLKRLLLPSIPLHHQLR